MAIVEKVTQEDLVFYEIMRNPILFGEFLSNFDKSPKDEEFKFSYYQKEFIGDFSNYISVMAGRAVGKTVSVTLKLLWGLVFKTFPNDYICYIVPSKNNLEPVWSNIIRMLRTNSFLKQFIQPNAGINSSDFKISLLNGSVLMCRIAGQTGTGVSVIGLHTPFFVVDESGYFPWGTFIELQPTINTFTPGFQLIVAGVPDGRREKSVCYHCDMENSNYSKHRIPAHKNPRFTKEDDLRAMEQYGGTDSDDYIHMVLAQHGRPVFSLFDRGTFSIAADPVYKLEFSGINLGDNIMEYYNRIATLPGIPDKKHNVIIGIDLGYTEPTAILIMYLDNFNRLHFHAKIRMEKVSYNLQERIIDLLDTKFKPAIIGVDKGSAGISVIQHLQNDTDYVQKNYDKRLIPIDFSGSIILGIDNEGKEIKNKTKPYAVSILQDYSTSHKIIYSSTDLELVTELERMSYTKNPNGDISYKTLTPKGGKKGEDHFTSALLCAVLAYYLTIEFMETKQQKKKLVMSSWL